jgi:RNase P/RNase MRP subunit POP5
VYSIVKGIRRYRYISFQLKTTGQQGSPTESELIQALRKQASDLFSKDAKELGLWMIRFDGARGILKCNYQEKERAIQLLLKLKNIGSNHIKITTHACSGTIRGLTDPQKHSR